MINQCIPVFLLGIQEKDLRMKPTHLRLIMLVYSFYKCKPIVEFPRTAVLDPNGPDKDVAIKQPRLQ